MKRTYKNIIFSLFLGAFTIPLTIGGIFDYNMIVHQHLIQIFGQFGDGALGIFFLLCYLHDSIIIFVILHLTTSLTKKLKRKKTNPLDND